jgi:hypothetical protein
MRVGQCFLPTNAGGRTIVCLLTKTKVTDNSSYEQLESCLSKLAVICKQRKIKEIGFPKFDGGMDKLDWSRVKALINHILISKGIKCIVYTRGNQERSTSNNELNVNKDIKSLQEKDDEIKELKNKVNSGKIKGFIFEEGVLLKMRKARNGRWYKQVVVPRSMRTDVLRMCHDDLTGAHLGQRKTVAKLCNRFYWPNCHKEAINYVESCEKCAKRKPPAIQRAPLKPITEFDKPFDQIGLDILELSRTSSGNKYCAVFTDYLTKWVEAVPLRNMTAETVAKALVEEVITRHSAPSKILTDQGQNFHSKLISAICDYMKIKKVQTAAYNPKCDGLTERFNRTLCQMLAMYSNSNQTNWDMHLQWALYAYRTSEHTITGDSPFALLYGREPRLGDLDNYNLGYQPCEFVKNLHQRWQEAKDKIVKAAKMNKEYYDNKYIRQPTKYCVGDWIRVKQPQTKVGLKRKLRNDFWSDPYRITNVLSEQNVEIDYKGQKKVVNVDNIKRKEPIRILNY